MKYRTDSEDKSSCSSYIISRCRIGDDATIDDLYKTIIGFYQEGDEKTAQQAKYSITNRNSASYKEDCENLPYALYDTGDPVSVERLENDGNIFVWGAGGCGDLLSWYKEDCKIDWDYKHAFFFKDKGGIKNYLRYNGYDDDVVTLTDGNPKLNCEKICSKCDMFTTCGLRKHMDEKGYTAISGVLYLGDFAVASRNNYIPAYVMERLHSISNYSCECMSLS